MENHLQKLRRAREKRPSYREVLELAENILVEKQELKTQGSFPPLPLDPSQVRIQMEGGFPYLSPGKIPFSPTQTREYFFRLLGLFKKQNPQRHEKLEKVLDERRFVLETFLKLLLENQLTQERLVEVLAEEGSLLFFFLVQSVKPTFEVYAQNWRTTQKELSWSHGYCPFCGGYPGMGELRGEGGKRVLHCLLCATKWDYPRLKCPYCANEDQEKLTYFQVEGEAGNRVEICLVCRHYLKTVDSREMEGPLDFYVEDFLTLHLDHLAQEEGYLRPEKLFVNFK